MVDRIKVAIDKAMREVTQGMNKLDAVADIAFAFLEGWDEQGYLELVNTITVFGKEFSLSTKIMTPKEGIR